MFYQIAHKVLSQMGGNPSDKGEHLSMVRAAIPMTVRSDGSIVYALNYANFGLSRGILLEDAMQLLKKVPNLFLVVLK